MTFPILDVRNLTVQFNTDSGTIQAVDQVSFQVQPGQTLGIVGESGSGKSVSCLAAMGLIPTPPGRILAGEIWFRDRPTAEPVDLLTLPAQKLRHYRGAKMGMIFQEPMSSLNPLYTCGFQIIEAIQHHDPVAPAEARRRALNLLQEVRLFPQDEDLLRQYRQDWEHSAAAQDPGATPPSDRELQQQVNQYKQSFLKRYPHELSGGQMQRVMIAIALSCNPSLLIADEPTTALDVTVQAAILNLLRDLGKQREMGVIFVSHDLGVIAEIADRVAVMYQGKIVEQGRTIDLFQNPQHPYTQGLLACRPRLDQTVEYLPTIADFMKAAEQQVESQTDGEGEKLDHRQPISLSQPIPKSAPSSQAACSQTTSSQTTSSQTTSTATISSTSSAMSSEQQQPEQKQPEQPQPEQVPLLQVRDLHVSFPIKGVLGQVQSYHKAVDGVSFEVYAGETLGLVGESGCGKTTLARSLLRLIKPRSGQILFQGQDLCLLSPAALRRLRRDMQIIFQNPYSSLDPRMTVGAAVMEPMLIHAFNKKSKGHRDRAAYLLERVGLGADALRRYPHAFSGGQRQRICIARALALNPRFIICDESVSALDVSVQAQVLNLLKELQKEFGLTYIFISHDLSVVKFMSDRIMVMNQGKIEEIASATTLYTNPQTDYTRRLIAAIPTGEVKVA